MTRVTIETNHVTATIIEEDDDLSIHQVIDMVKRALIGVTYSPSLVDGLLGDVEC